METEEKEQQDLSGKQKIKKEKQLNNRNDKRTFLGF
jgi:hypothetical protein